QRARGVVAERRVYRVVVEAQLQRAQSGAQVAFDGRLVTEQRVRPVIGQAAGLAVQLQGRSPVRGVGVGVAEADVHAVRQRQRRRDAEDVVARIGASSSNETGAQVAQLRIDDGAAARVAVPGGVQHV